MKKLKNALALLLAAIFVLAACPALGAGENEPERGTHRNVIVDTDPAGGYTGDYVVIYNSNTSSGLSASTGSLSGLIETEVYGSVTPAEGRRSAENGELPYKLDVDADIEKAAESQPALPKDGKRETFTVGMTKNFYIANYNPAGTGYLQFKLLYQGTHYNIWTVTTAAYKPLDLIDAGFAQTAAEEFDSKFDLMRLSYGDFNDMNGDGRVNLMYYNIDDGWTLGQGYVAGYFSKADFENYNYLPMIHIDTYPGIQYVNAAGVERVHFEDTFGTVVHEFQHCINYSETGGMATWLNEAFSGSAEELCYPGSGLFTRIPEWHDVRLTMDMLEYPPVEYAYNPYFGLHRGGSITAWSSAEDDIYARYAEVMLFTQYLSTRYGSTSVYRRIIEANDGTTTASSYAALENGTGWSIDSILGGFFTSMIANDADSGYGFRMNAGYDPDEYYGIENLYDLLSPVVYTSGAAASIYAGGFITVKPVGGVFDPPSGASSNLKYVGISFGNVGINGVTLAPSSVEMLMDQTAELVLRKDPADANYFEVVWSSSDPGVVTVSGNKNGATLTSHAFGTAVVTASVTDTATGAHYSASAFVRVRNGYTYTYYEQVNEVQTGVPYLIGYDTGSAVYVMMSYNPNPDNSYYPNYYNYQSTYYSYGAKAVLDNEGRVLNVENNVYPDVALIHAEWTFEAAESGYYKIRSCYDSSKTLVVYAAGSSYYDLYANGTGNNNKWKWDAANGRLKYEVSSSTIKYATFVPSVGARENVFGAYVTDSSYAAIKLYRKATGTVILDDDPVTYTVTFLDGLTGSVISTVTVEEGQAASAPAAPAHEGYHFIGWDADFSSVTGDMTVTAQYEINNYTLTVYYLDEHGAKIADAFVGSFAHGRSYSVASPAVSGYTPDIAVVSGVMTSDLTVIVTYYEDAPAGLPGDVDCNGAVNMADLALAASYVQNSGEVSAQGILNGDMNGDGVLSAADLAALYALILG